MKIISKSCVAVLLLTGFVLPVTPANAGFEWVAPSNSIPSPPSGNSYAPAPKPVPLYPTAGAPDVVSPVVISGDNRSGSMPQSLAPLPPSPTSMPLQSDERPNLATQTIAVPALTNTPASDTVVQGFASQVPLTLALRQVLPADYNFSIDQDVSMDTPVSYSGGKPWRETLTTMLASAGLVGREQGNVYSISHIQAGGPAPIISDEAPEIIAPDKPTLHSSFPAPAPQIMSVSSSAPEPPFTVGSARGADEWTAERGDTLRKVLTEWSRRANVELQWMTEYDYPIEGSSHFNSSFEDAVRGLLVGFDGARPQPVAELHDSTTAGQKVLVVQARGNNYSN